MDGVAGEGNEIFEFLQEVAYVHVTNQWRMLEVELAKLKFENPQAFELLQEAWSGPAADGTTDGWLVAPPWAPSSE